MTVYGPNASVKTVNITQNTTLQINITTVVAHVMLIETGV